LTAIANDRQSSPNSRVSCNYFQGLKSRRGQFYYLKARKLLRKLFGKIITNFIYFNVLLIIISQMTEKTLGGKNKNGKPSFRTNVRKHFCAKHCTK
jgi:hypothetical protein